MEHMQEVLNTTVDTVNENQLGQIEAQNGTMTGQGTGIGKETEIADHAEIAQRIEETETEEAEIEIETETETETETDIVTVDAAAVTERGTTTEDPAEEVKAQDTAADKVVVEIVQLFLSTSDQES
ncbi:unnamed protein product [Umbelopsis vinacea]